MDGKSNEIEVLESPDLSVRGSSLYNFISEKSSLFQIPNEVHPYKNLMEVYYFTVLYDKNQLPEWLSKTQRLKPATSYCFPHWQMLADSRQPMLRRSVPKTLVCHDFKGGYLQDRFVDYKWDDPEGYIFADWSLVDIFVYFSHHLVTVPPPCWINAGHAQGVPVLGTLITEGEIGRQVWTDVLSSSSTWEWFADCLVLIMKVHGFDGYLLNVENSLTPDDVIKLIAFVRYLRSSLPKSSKLIWYDSVTNQGKLAWQNALNLHNVDFFKVCDGIFLNYNYQNWQLERSSQLAAARRHDVFVGVDVFGRGCPGSGFLSSDAVKMARENDLSIAIFAPGWTTEVAPGDRNLNSTIFWSALSRFLFVHGIAGNSESQVDTGRNDFMDVTAAGDNFFIIDLEEIFLLKPSLPSTDLSRERAALLDLQDGVVTYKEQDVRKYYAKFPVLACTRHGNHLNICNMNAVSSKVPLVMLETEVNGRASVTLGTGKEDDKSQLYITIQEAGDVIVDYTGSTEVHLRGNVLEIGVVMPPDSRITIKQLRVVIPK